jgi:hypothetical protein
MNDALTQADEHEQASDPLLAKLDHTIPAEASAVFRLARGRASA